VLGAVGAFVYLRVGRDLLAQLDLGLSSRAAVIESDLGHGRATTLATPSELVDPDESFAQVLDQSGRVLVSSSEPTATPLVGPLELGSIGAPTYLTRSVARIDADPVRLLILPTHMTDRPAYLVVGATLGDRRDALRGLLVSLAIGGPAALLLASWAGWMVAGGALRPVERMRREAAAISASEPARRLPVPATGDELTRLGTTLNAMLDRLQESFERERRFVDDASHELRTPLSVLKMELELAGARSRTPEELEQALRNALAETDRLVRLAEDLLVLARTEHGRLPLRREPVSLADLLDRVCSSHRPRARSAGVQLNVVAVPEEPVAADPVRLRQAVDNLVDNALALTPPGGSVNVEAVREDGRVGIAVEDTGPGFDPRMLEEAFEPFARPTGRGARDGSGLGLAIVRAIAEAHGGEATAENRPGGGARVRIWLAV
ncbi:MAG TPA: ATP-binding protein, partial [Actinomycetota bacterium]|nr:ATP-binding protein [Actinomycetota bacterium]